MVFKLFNNVFSVFGTLNKKGGVIFIPDLLLNDKSIVPHIQVIRVLKTLNLQTKTKIRNREIMNTKHKLITMNSITRS